MAGLVAVVANPWLARQVDEGEGVSPGSGPISPGLYEEVSFPAWVVPDPPLQSMQTALAYDARAILLVVLVGALVYRLLRFFRVRRGRFVVLLLVWAAVIVAAALAGVLGSPLVNGVLGDGVRDPAHNAVDFAMSQLGDGARYGLIVGWLPALLAALVAGRRRSRRPSPQ